MFKKLTLCLVLAATMFSIIAAPVNANSVAWDGGTFTWSLVRLNNSTAQARVGFTRSTRLILIGEVQVNATGQRLAVSGTREVTGTAHALNANNLISGHHGVFFTHEARGASSIARFTSLAF